MKEFYTINQFRIKGRGQLHVIELGPNDKIKVGEEILLDGEVKIINGIDVQNSKSALSAGASKLRDLRLVAIFAKEPKSA